MYWTRILLIVQITTVRSSIIDPFRSFLWAISLNNLFLSFGNLSAERFLNYLLANYAFLNFDLLSVRSLNFPKISASFLIRPFFIIGDCVYRARWLTSSLFVVIAHTDIPKATCRALPTWDLFWHSHHESKHC